MIPQLVKGRFRRPDLAGGWRRGAGVGAKTPGSWDPGVAGERSVFLSTAYLTVRKNSLPEAGRGMVYGLAAPATVTHEPRLRLVELCRVPE